jgi:hypothetical protein
VFARNIVGAPYAPILMDYWGERIDSNVFLSEEGLGIARAIGLDRHGWFGGRRVVDSVRGCLRSGEFGVRVRRLRAVADFSRVDPLIV